MTYKSESVFPILIYACDTFCDLLLQLICNSLTLEDNNYNLLKFSVNSINILGKAVVRHGNQDFLQQPGIYSTVYATVIAKHKANKQTVSQVFASFSVCG